MPTNIFISYSHRDEVWKDLIVKYLLSLGDEDIIDVWDDHRIGAGDELFKEIKQAIQEAKIAVLLVSVDFLNSEFILKEEIPDLLRKRQEEGLRVIPFIIRSCPWKRRLPWLKEILARPKDGSPLNLYSPADQDAILDKFADEIYSFLPEPDIELPRITSAHEVLKTSRLKKRVKPIIDDDAENYVRSIHQYVENVQSLPDQIIELLQTGTYVESLRQPSINIGDKQELLNIKNLPVVVLHRLLSEGYLNISSKGQPPEDEVNYEYQAKRFGMGYRLFNVKCDVQKDGSARVIRTVELEAYSLLREIDTVIQIPEQDPDGKYRDIEIGTIKSLDDHELSLNKIEPKPGRISAMINIRPALKQGERLKYQVSDYSLEKGLFAIDLTPDDHLKRKDPDDYFGWHITRPTKSFVLQVQFPFGYCPKQYWHEVRYATSSAIPDKIIQLGEQRRLKGPENDPLIDPDNLRLEVNFPLSSLVYIIKWKPLLIP